ncbi:MAG: epimerase [Nitrospirota bacterium]
MKVILFGATGMVGQGVLRECLLNPDVHLAQTIGRTAVGRGHQKLREIVRQNLYDYSDTETDLTGFDACFFCLGISSAGMKEEDYERVTYGITLAAAKTLSRLNPDMTFIYVSGMGTDSTEQGRIMWARVKGKTENALLRLPFKAVYLFRPAFIRPLHGMKSKTKIYRIMYAISAPLFPLLNVIFPHYLSTTEKIGRAMINVAMRGYPKKILETRDINSAATCR